MTFRLKRNKKPSLAQISFKTEKNEKGKMQGCVYAECEFTGDKAGPVWGQGLASIKRVLSLLTSSCGCPAVFHKSDLEYE